MMSPYLAIIRDSFHSALSSRILWVAFAAIWLLLAGLAPIGYREDFTTTFLGRDFENGTRLKAMLAEGLISPDAAKGPLGRIAAALPDDLQRQLRRVGQGDEVRIRFDTLSDGLNQLLEDDTWYESAAWNSTMKVRELRDLDERDSSELTESLRRRRARLRMEAALPGVFHTRSSRSIVLTYAGWDFPANFQVDKTQFVTLVNQWVVPTIINWLLGFVLVFLGILVTASIIPDMLQPGSLHLLLSKPISRTMLLLSKFVGGCAFVFLCVLQLIIGLYLIAGLRLDLWNVRIMWCIPVSVFLFAVFYSVSTLAGLKWRSPILAIGVTCMFGAFCLVVGLIGGFFDTLVTGPQRIQSLATIDQIVIASTQGGGLIRFDPSSNRWIELIESDPMSGDRTLFPVRLDNQHIATANVRGGRFNPYGSGSLDLLMLSDTNGWQPEPSVRLPTGTTRLFPTRSGSLFAMTTGALMATNLDRVIDATEDDQEPLSGGDDRPTLAANDASSKFTGWLSRLTGMQGGTAEGFQNKLPTNIALTHPRGLFVADDGRHAIALTQGRVMRFDAEGISDDRIWKLSAEHTLLGETTRGSMLTVSGNVVLVARPDEPLTFLSAHDLTPLGTLPLPSSLSMVTAISIGSGGHFGLITSDAKCRLLETSSEPNFVAVLKEPLPIGEVHALYFDAESRNLLVVHHVDQVDWVEFDTLTRQRTLRPSLSRWRLVDKYIVTPLRTLTPQTGELGDTIASMISGKSAVTVPGGSQEEPETVRYKIARPLISCAGFIVVMLTISCLYFARSDF